MTLTLNGQDEPGPLAAAHWVMPTRSGKPRVVRYAGDMEAMNRAIRLAERQEWGDEAVPYHTLRPEDARLGRDPDNPSGIHPIEYRVVILPDEVEEKSKGGIIIPQDVRERHQMAQVQGVLVAVGGLAFTVDGVKWPDPPQVGDRVMIAKYTGLEAEGKDGKKYRVCNDKDVCAVMR